MQILHKLESKIAWVYARYKLKLNTFVTLLWCYLFHSEFAEYISWAPARGEQGGQAPTLEKNQSGHGPPWKF